MQAIGRNTKESAKQQDQIRKNRHEAKGGGKKERGKEREKGRKGKKEKKKRFRRKEPLEKEKRGRKNNMKKTEMNTRCGKLKACNTKKKPTQGE